MTGSTEAPSEDAARSAAPAGGAAQRVPGAGPNQRKIELVALKEVLLDPSQDVQLRVWTAKMAAELYPAETAEMATSELFGDDPKILVGIANTVQLDTEGRVRTALESLAKHGDEAVVAAVAERIGGAP